MIRLTSALSNYPLWVNPDHITTTGTGWCLGRERTHVYLVVDTDREQDPYFVAESPAEVARKVLEWKLAMERFRTALLTDKKEIAMAEYLHLKQLAGLEGEA